MKSSGFKKRFLVRLFVILTITIIASIYYFSERTTFSYQGYDKNVNLLQRYNAELNEAVVKTRFGIIENYDSINSALSSLAGVLNEFELGLQNFPNDKLKNKLLSLEKSAELKTKITYHFIRINPILINAINQFSRILASLIGSETISSNDNNPQTKNIQLAISEKTNVLLQKMLIYINLPRKEAHNELLTLISDIESLVNQIQDKINSSNDAKSKENFKNLNISLMYAKKILELQPQASTIDEKLFEVPIIANLNELNNAFASIAETHLKRSSAYRIVLYLLVFFLLIVIRWVFLRLQGTLSTLNIEIERKNRAEEELEEINRQLEQRVSDRTRELSLKNEDLNKVLANLKETQDQLIIQEKMASVGMLTTGIAHEIKNPLNFVNNFSDISIDLLDELKNEILSQKSKLDGSVENTIEDILGTLKINVTKIKEHGERADNIVKTMLLHSREASTQKEMVDIRTLMDDTLRIGLEAFKAAHESFDLTVEKHYQEKFENALVAPQAIGRVFIYILDNSFYALEEKVKKSEQGYQPTLDINIAQKEKLIIIKIRDNGPGIPKKILDKVFQPFFTTKPTGKGNTGLGLSICYDTIVKQHNGELKVVSEEGTFTEFIITIPMLQKDSE